MADIVNPHDKFFKETLSQPGAAEQFLRYFVLVNDMMHAKFNAKMQRSKDAKTQRETLRLCLSAPLR